MTSRDISGLQQLTGLLSTRKRCADVTYCEHNRDFTCYGFDSDLVPFVFLFFSRWKLPLFQSSKDQVIPATLMITKRRRSVSPSARNVPRSLPSSRVIGEEIWKQGKSKVGWSKGRHKKSLLSKQKYQLQKRGKIEQRCVKKRD